MVPELVVVIASAYGVMFVAELGDKTQLLALGFGARHSLRVVAIGLTLGYAAAGSLAVLVGGLLGAALPERPIAIVAGLLFLTFAALAIRDDEDGAERVVHTRGAIASITLTIALAEMGDKTQLATAALASQTNPLGTWVGATLGMATAGVIGAELGRRIGSRLPARTLRLTSAALFAVFGLVLLVAAF